MDEGLGFELHIRKRMLATRDRGYCQPKAIVNTHNDGNHNLLIQRTSRYCRFSQFAEISDEYFFTCSSVENVTYFFSHS